MKLGWIVYDCENDPYPVFHTTEPYYGWKIVAIAYGEIIK